MDQAQDAELWSDGQPWRRKGFVRRNCELRVLEMTIRTILLGVALTMAQSLVAATALTAGPDTFEVMGLRLGATVEEIKAAAKNNELTDVDVTPGPSFEQAVLTAQRKMIQAREYGGVQTIRARNQTAEALVSFVPTPDGPRAVKIVYDVLPGGAEVSALESQLVSEYSEPDQKTDREWVWGDTAVFYSRKSAYMEFRPNPVSAGARKPVATVILADPALQKRSREAIANEVRKGS